MRLLKFIHANTEAPVQLVAEQVFGWYYSSGQRCSLILSTGGAMVPVKETVEEISRLMQTKE
jgi:hypothetical protein